LNFHCHSHSDSNLDTNNNLNDDMYSNYTNTPTQTMTLTLTSTSTIEIIPTNTPTSSSFTNRFSTKQKTVYLMPKLLAKPRRILVNGKLLLRSTIYPLIKRILIRASNHELDCSTTNGIVHLGQTKDIHR